MSSEPGLSEAAAPSAEPLPHGVAIRVSQLSKCYQIYDQPKDRLKQSIYPRLQRLAGLGAKKYHRDFWALRDVSFEVARGETVGIVGKNGSGKSTLLHLIVGTHAVTAGSIEVAGRITALLELGSGFNPLFTGRENVYLNAAVSGLSRDETDRRFDEIASFADIGVFMDQPVSTYSSGMYVRLAFAVQVCLDPDIFVVDEALAVGDAYFVHRCFHRIRMLKEQGKTILFVSHDTASVNNLCDRAIWLNEGRLKLEGKPDDVTASYRADLFGLAMGDGPAGAPAAGHAAVPADVLPSRAAAETVIPNTDRRMGGRGCSIVGVGLYDAAGTQRIAVARPGREVSLRISVVNESLPEGTSLVLGYEIFTFRGENLGGVNTRMEGLELEAPRIGEIITVSARIGLPVLHAGHYAITPAVASHQSQELRIEDRVENAIVFEMLGEKEVVGWLRFPTTFSAE